MADVSPWWGRQKIVGALELRPSGARQCPAIQPRPTMEKEETP
nr:MAG TPA: hypothetical protein [Caudoviricetes sp.]